VPAGIGGNQVNTFMDITKPSAINEMEIILSRRGPVYSFWFSVVSSGMQKSTVSTLRFFCSIFFCALFLALTSIAVLAQADKQPLPGSPLELMRLAARKNVLSTPEIRPWHLKVSFKTLDGAGAITDQGTFEELWVGPRKFRRTLTDTTHTQTDYGTEKGVLRTGEQEWSHGNLDNVHRAFVDPLPGDFYVAQSELKSQQRDVEGLKLDCVDLWGSNRPMPSKEDLWFSFCFDANAVLHQATMPGWDNTQITSRNIAVFDGHAVPGDIEVRNGGILTLTAHLESIGRVTAADDPEFRAPADAKLHDQDNMTLSAIAAKDRLLHMVPPSYVHDQGIHGTVVLKGTISEDGSVKDLQVISGPKMLQQVTIDAVKQWRYHPHTLGGAPVEMETTIIVYF
jgi:TonB family protein